VLQVFLLKQVRQGEAQSLQVLVLLLKYWVAVQVGVLTLQV
jgi:hypothetical protein